MLCDALSARTGEAMSQLVVPFSEATILADVRLDIALNGELCLALMDEPMTRIGSSSRQVYTDSTRTVAVKCEHSYLDGVHDYAVQCWNEYVYWGEYVQGTPESELLVPTLELDVRFCPMPLHNRHGNKCIVMMNLQEYINDGLADGTVFIGAPEGYDPNPWDDCMRPLLRRRPELSGDVHKDRPDQARYCMVRGRYVLVDYGLPGAYGWALDSAYYDSPREWREAKGVTR